jgi:chromosome segregation ATPase
MHNTRTKRTTRKSVLKSSAETTLREEITRLNNELEHRYHDVSALRLRNETLEDERDRIALDLANAQAVDLDLRTKLEATQDLNGQLTLALIHLCLNLRLLPQQR